MQSRSGTIDKRDASAVQSTARNSLIQYITAANQTRPASITQTQTCTHTSSRTDTQTDRQTGDDDAADSNMI